MGGEVMEINEIKAARNAAGLSQRKMSELLGIPRRTIEDWDAGKCQPPTWVKQLLLAELERIAEKIKNK